MKIKKVSEMDDTIIDIFDEIRDKFSAHDCELKYYPNLLSIPYIHFYVPRDKFLEALDIEQPETYSKHGGTYVDGESLQARLDDAYNKLIADDDFLTAIDRVSDTYNITFDKLKVYFSGNEILLMLIFDRTFK